MGFSSPVRSLSLILVNGAHQDFSALNHLQKNVDPAHTVATAQRISLLNPLSGDFPYTRTMDRSTFSNVQLITAVLITMLAVHTTIYVICQRDVLETALVFSVDRVNLVSQKLSSLHNAEKVSTARITGSGSLLCFTAYHLPSFFCGRLPS